MRVVVASNNPGKLAEIAEVLGAAGHGAVSLSEAGIESDPLETGTTLEENARLKVDAARREAAIPDSTPVIADDTGFSIPALGGEPGIYVRRWRDRVTEMTDEEIVAHCISRMRGVEDRRAVATSVIACSWRGETRFVRGELHGRVVETPTGTPTPGFPLERLFYVDEWGTMLGAARSLSPERRAELPTHRGRALAALVDVLPSE